MKNIITVFITFILLVYLPPAYSQSCTTDGGTTCASHTRVAGLYADASSGVVYSMGFDDGRIGTTTSFCGSTSFCNVGGPNGYGIDANGSTFYIARGTGGVSQITNIGSCSIGWTTLDGDDMRGVAYMNGRLFASVDQTIFEINPVNGSDMNEWDITSVLSPNGTIARLEAGPGNQLFFSDSNASGQGGFGIFDISTATATKFTGAMGNSINAALGLEYVNGWLLGIERGQNRIHAIDVANPTNNSVIASGFNDIVDVSYTSANGGQLVVADFGAGQIKSFVCSAVNTAPGGSSSNCPPSYSQANGNRIAGSSTANQVYETDGIIETKQMIIAPHMIDYDSKQSIDFLPNFQVGLGAMMQAIIDGCGTTSGPTCSDGIQNQGETGIDCGGPCAACPPTCSDGIQNQGETGVDCGGPCAPCNSMNPRIIADGFFDDWNGLPIAYTDASGDGGSNGIDFGQLQVFNDPEYLFLTFTTGVELNLQLSNLIVNNMAGPEQQITIYLDTDDNASTGLPINGVGAEFEYTFGALGGNYYNASGSPTPIVWDEIGTTIGVVSVPAISSTQFEIAINRNNAASGSPIFPNNSNNIKIVISDNTANGDMMPAQGQTIDYTFSSGTLGPLPNYSFSKLQASDVRVMCYNTEFNSVIDSLHETDAYKRIFAATQPDIIAFQEIWRFGDDDPPPPTSQELANRMNTLYPIPGGWQHHQRYGADLVLISKYPILQHAYIPGAESMATSGAGAFLVDIPGSKDLLVINGHPPFGAQYAIRQMEIDQMMEWLRDAKAGMTINSSDGPWTLPPNTPFAIMGDMNLVGNDEEVETFVTGNIVNAQHEPDFNPDWDGSNLEHVNNFLTEAPFSFTWYNTHSSAPFSPAKLDGVFYSGSVMTLPNQFGLFTPTLPQSVLNATGLQANDIPQVSDHLPLIMDFRITP